MNPIQFKKISKEHFYSEIHRLSKIHFRHMVDLFGLVRPDLDEKEREEFCDVLDSIAHELGYIEKISLPYRPIGEKNEY